MWLKFWYHYRLFFHLAIMPEEVDCFNWNIWAHAYSACVLSLWQFPQLRNLLCLVFIMFVSNEIFCNRCYLSTCLKIDYNEYSANSTSFIGKRKNESFFINVVGVLIGLFQLYTSLEMEKKHSVVQPKDYSNTSSSFIVEILTFIPDLSSFLYF